MRSGIFGLESGELMGGERLDLGSQIEVLEDDPVFILEGKVLGITEQIVGLMEGRGITREDLAFSLGESSEFVTKFLSGDDTFSLGTLVKIGLILGQELKVTFVPGEK